jgi:hypothetical protein
MPPITTADLYLNLLKRSLTDTLGRAEPDHQNPQDVRFIADFIGHYIRGRAVSMLPLVRFDNLQSCIEAVLRDGVPGDLIETGVWRGGATIFMRGALEALGDRTRQVFVADSFEGLPEPDAEKYPIEAQAYHGAVMAKAMNRLEATLEDVEANFAAYGLLDDRVRFLKGWFKDTLPSAPVERLALMRLDGDYYESTRDALEALYDKLSPGGFVIIDDYAEDHWTYCRRAVDEFREARGITTPLQRVDAACWFWRREA